MLVLRKYVLAMGIPILVALLSVFGFSAGVRAEEVVTTTTFTGTMQLLSRGVDGAVANKTVRVVDMSSDGKCILAWSNATNLTEDELLNNRIGMYVFEDGVIKFLHTQEQWTFPVAISDNCRYVTFRAQIAPNNVNADYYVFDRASGAEMLVTRLSDGSKVGENNYSAAFSKAGGTTEQRGATHGEDDSVKAGQSTRRNRSGQQP